MTARELFNQRARLQTINRTLQARKAITTTEQKVNKTIVAMENDAQTAHPAQCAHPAHQAKVKPKRVPAARKPAEYKSTKVRDFPLAGEKHEKPNGDLGRPKSCTSVLNDIPRGWVPVRDFARKHGLSETGLFNAVRNGRIASVKVGHCRYINPADYERHRELSKANRAEAAQRAIEARKRHAAARREGTHAEVS